MAITYKFFNAVQQGGSYDRTYNAEDFTSYLGSLVSNGVFAKPSTNMQVYAYSGMNVLVRVGKAWIDGHMMEVTENETLALQSASSTLPRIDRIVAYIDYTNRLMGLRVLTGTPASDPTTGKVALTRTSTFYEMCLAEVLVPRLSHSVSQGNITDTRSDSSVCGWVTGMIDQIDTSTLFAQYETAYAEATAELTAANAQFMGQMQTYLNNMQTAFDSWFATLTEQLVVATYFAQYKKTVVANFPGAATYEIPLDMAGYAYDSADVILVWVNGLKATEGIDYSIFVSSQTKVVLNILGATTENQTIDILAIKSKVGFDTLMTSEDDDVVDADNNDIVV